MDDPRGPRMIPDGRVVLNGIVAHGDDDVSRRQELISRSIVQLADPSCKALEEICRNRSCRLEGANNR